MSLYPRSNFFFNNVDSALQSNVLEFVIELVYSKLILTGDTVIDGGAHAGLHTIPMARLVGGSGKVIAVEALERFAHNILHNNLLSENLRDAVSIFNVALGKEEGRLKFTDFTAAPGYSGLKPRTDVPDDIRHSQVEIEVQVRTIDQIVDEVSACPVRFVKLDLEGAEFDAIRGAYKTISTNRPAIVFEFGQQSSASLYSYSKEEFFDFFNKINYKVMSILGEPINMESWDKGYMAWYALAIPNEECELSNTAMKIVSEVDVMSIANTMK